MSASAVILDIVSAVIGKLRDKPADWSADKIAQAVADKATEALVTVIAAELAKFQAALGVVLATHEVAEATQHVLEAFESKGGKSFGALPMTEMPADWKPGDPDPGTTEGNGGGVVAVDPEPEVA